MKHQFISPPAKVGAFLASSLGRHFITLFLVLMISMMPFPSFAAASPSEITKEAAVEDDTVLSQDETVLDETEAKQEKTYYGFRVVSKKKMRRAPASGTTGSGDTIEFYVHYDGQGGTVTGVPDDYHHTGTSIGRLPTATMKGYKFLGWYTTPDGDDSGEKITEDTVPTGEVTYYAHWEMYSYMVCYYGNDGEGEMTGENVEVNIGSDGTKTYYQIYTVDEHDKLSKNTFTRDGYTFLGWNRNKNSKTAELQDEAEIYNLSTIGTRVNLFAIWQKEQNFYDITFDLNGGEGTLEGSDLTLNDDGTYSAKVNQEVNAYTITNKLTKPDYNFIGWSTDPNATIPDFSGTDTSSLNNLNTIVDSTNKVTLYAVWQEKTYAGFKLHAIVNGNMADMDRTMHVKLTVYFHENSDNVHTVKPLNGTYHYIKNGEEHGHSFTFTNGEVTFDMKNGDTIVFPDLPVSSDRSEYPYYQYSVKLSDLDLNSEYEITMENTDGTDSVLSNDRANPHTYGRLTEAGAEVTITETLDGAVPTGVNLPHAPLYLMILSITAMMSFMLKKTR